MLLCQLVARFTISLIQFLRLITFKSRDKICKVKCEKKLLNKSIQAMSLETDKSAIEVEVKHFFTLLAKSKLSD